MSRPVVALTMGDVAGIGPEVIARACTSPLVQEICHPVVVGHPAVLERAVKLVGSPLNVVSVREITAASDDSKQLCCWNPSSADVGNVPAGQNDARAGKGSYDWLVAAAHAALDGRIDAICTAPLSKAALHLAGHKFPGHTEILAEVCGVKNFAMMLYLPPGAGVKSDKGLGVAHVTLHTSIASVPGLISPQKVAESIELLATFLRRVGIENPAIGVCALNPHAGEGGIFGDEESRLIAPGIEAARKDGCSADGPIPADALMRRAVAGEFDGVVAMYHDQGHIALKLVAFDEAVNVTLGLPIIRTSPSQGTAFDIAWQGVARPDGMIGAIRTAALLCQTRDRDLAGK